MQQFFLLLDVTHAFTKKIF